MKYTDRQIKHFDIPEHEMERLKRRGKFEKRKGKKKRVDKGK
jgi:hypothetical protein